MASSCKNLVSLKQSDFSIEHILTRAGERFAKRRKITEHTYQPGHYCPSLSPNSQSDSDSSDQVLHVDDTEDNDDEDLVRNAASNSPACPRAGPSAFPPGTACVPSFDWLYYTRYHPPKLPRPQKAGPAKRTPGRLPRVPFTPSQLSALEEAYKVSTYLSSEEANQLAYNLDLTNTRVKIWFQNRRARDRREKREAVAPDSVGALPLYHGSATSGKSSSNSLPTTPGGGESTSSHGSSQDRNY